MSTRTIAETLLAAAHTFHTEGAQDHTTAMEAYEEGTKEHNHHKARAKSHQNAANVVSACMKAINATDLVKRGDEIVESGIMGVHPDHPRIAQQRQQEQQQQQVVLVPRTGQPQPGSPARKAVVSPEFQKLFGTDDDEGPVN